MAAPILRCRAAVWYAARIFAIAASSPPAAFCCADALTATLKRSRQP